MGGLGSACTISTRARFRAADHPGRYLGEMNLGEHRLRLAACRRCGLHADVAPIQSLAVAPKVMIVGQAPGKVESSGGMPFAGRAGRTLFRWLAGAGIDEASARRRIYIAAVTRCYPGSSPSGRGDRVPSREEQDACAGWLDSELAIIRPKVIIPIGKLALARFLPSAPLEHIIGVAHRANDLHGGPLLIPLPHPSGASSWIHQGNHPRLLQQAIALIAEHVRPLVMRERALEAAS
jgi:uracil-DNA glycosylase